MEVGTDGTGFSRWNAWCMARGSNCAMCRVQSGNTARDADNTDGEIVTATPAHFRVLPGAISVFTSPQLDKESRTLPLHQR